MTFAKKRIRIVCPRSGNKILFPSYKSAEAYLQEMQKRSRHPKDFQSTHIYYCKACGGYHTSTSTESRFERMSPKARAGEIYLRRIRKNPAPTKPQARLNPAPNSAPIPEKSQLIPNQDIPNIVIPGRIYRHFKGDYYQILTTAKFTETDESLVVYRLLYHNKKKVWARPFKEFISEVDHQKYPNVRQKFRFTLQNVKGQRKH